MNDFISFRTTYEGEELVLNKNQISSINSAANSDTSTIRMRNGDEFEVKGNAEYLRSYFYTK